jgi:hypothetical protein
LKLLQRRSLMVARTSAELMEKVQAIAEFERANVPVPLERIRQELLSVVDNDFGTWQASRAASMASRLLEIIDGDDPDVWPSETPLELAGPNYWPGPEDPFADLDLGVDTQGARDQWRTRVQGPPPWRKVDSGDEFADPAAA